MKRTVLTILAAAALGAAEPALAHHVMGGQAPDSLMAGLLSGLGHPIIGIDHLAFVVAVGLAAAFTPQRWLSPLAFVGATLAGCILFLAGVALPLAEIVITASVVLVGAMVLSGRAFPAWATVGVFAIAGVFHGWAYGAGIVGAEATPLGAYLAGFAVIQYGIAAGVMWVTRSVWRAADPSAIQPRLAGAVALGVGAAFLVENIEGMLFA